LRAVFLDLNGTLVEPVKVQHPSELTLLRSAIEAVRLLNQHGFLCPIITVQSRIAKQIFSSSDFLLWFASLQAQFRSHGAVILGPYVCPHQGRDQCACKKPQVLLYQQAVAKHDIVVSQSAVIGDTRADMQAAQLLGCLSCLVRTGHGERAIQEQHADQVASYVASDVLDAAQWLVARAT
jgi:D-glycero-D-manno-heptose 1,7-bisphosphate phosphatase